MYNSCELQEPSYLKSRAEKYGHLAGLKSTVHPCAAREKQCSVADEASEQECTGIQLYTRTVEPSSLLLLGVEVVYTAVYLYMNIYATIFMNIQSFVHKHNLQNQEEKKLGGQVTEKKQKQVT